MEGLDMQDKIAWYEEVLAQDPGSPLFFNLARLYLEQGEREKAVDSLQSGLDRNPAHAQARLLLIQTLADAHCRDTALQYMEPLLAGLGSSPDFWLLWAEKLEGEGRKDVAAAVRFIATDLKHGPLTWSQIVHKGLEDVANWEAQFWQSEIEEPLTGDGQDLLGERNAHILQDQAEDEKKVLDEQQQSLPGQEIHTAEEDLPSGGYRTVTMADILAGQGEFESALEIYAQLLAEEPDSERRQKISDRMEMVSQKISPRGETGTFEEEEQEGPEADMEDTLSLDVETKVHKSPKPYSGEESKKHELLRRLDQLASRLEAKG
ncbi:MAG: tetratricopeptide repeat protein [Desulfovermiculus sp.]|nr:tetratricopeptide repeat protein [Desulfovermiculus sp.]